MEPAPYRARPVPLGRRNHPSLPQEPHDPLVEMLIRPAVGQAVQARLRQIMAGFLNKSSQVHGRNCDTKKEQHQH